MRHVTTYSLKPEVMGAGDRENSQNALGDKFLKMTANKLAQRDSNILPTNLIEI